MALYLVEVRIDEENEDALTDTLDRLSDALDGGGRLVEAQVGLEEKRAFLIVDTDDEGQVERAVAAVELQPINVKEVLLIGQDIDDVKERSGSANYLVEWNLPEGLTMERYLKRKEEKSPLYEQVPEVQFERTYVCTDMSKCLCFYDSPDEDAVKKAREVVEAPIDKMTSIKKAGA